MPYSSSVYNYFTQTGKYIFVIPQLSKYFFLCKYVNKWDLHVSQRFLKLSMV